jgi:hypothetical protein
VPEEKILISQLSKPIEPKTSRPLELEPSLLSPDEFQIPSASNSKKEKAIYDQLLGLIYFHTVEKVDKEFGTPGGLMEKNKKHWAKMMSMNPEI